MSTQREQYGNIHIIPVNKDVTNLDDYASGIAEYIEEIVKHSKYSYSYHGPEVQVKPRYSYWFYIKNYATKAVFTTCIIAALMHIIGSSNIGW